MTGALENVECPTCGGRGENLYNQSFRANWAEGTYDIDDCPDCNGTGRTPENVDSLKGTP